MKCLALLLHIYMSPLVVPKPGESHDSPHGCLNGIFIASLLCCRLCFDVRGEHDLRMPRESFIALVRDRPEHEYNPDGVQQPEYTALIRTAKGRACDLYIASHGHFQASCSGISQCYV